MWAPCSERDVCEHVFFHNFTIGKYWRSAHTGWDCLFRFLALCDWLGILPIFTDVTNGTYGRLFDVATAVV